MKVSLIAHTTVLPQVMTRETGGIWSPEDDEEYFSGHSSVLSEFAGRECYQSWTKPNPATATNDGYLAHIIDVGHLSTFEHGSASLRFSGVSRSFTHELIRHRHFSISQLSQRYTVVKAESDDEDENPFVIPPLYYGDQEAYDILEKQWRSAVEAYDRLVSMYLPRLLQSGIDPKRARKMAREAARSVLPNMTPTSLVFTGNHRAWRWLLEMRGSIHADAEIRQVAILVYYVLRDLEPALYQDFHVVWEDGVEVVKRRAL